NQELQDSGVISAFLRLHPLAETEQHTLHEHATVVQHGETVYCDLSLTEQQLWQQTRSRERSYINRIRRDGFRVEIDDQWNQLDEFVELYYETMRRVAAADSYFFSRSYFQQIRDTLRDHATLIFVTAPDGTIASGGIFTQCNGFVQYHLGGTRTHFLKAQPAKLLMHNVRQWAKQQGHNYFHLGGGVGSAHDSLFQFKSGFSKLRASFASCRFVTNEKAYSRLVKQWERENQSKADDARGYFPAYRKPAPRFRVVGHPEPHSPLASPKATGSALDKRKMAA
ncbi:MAG: GNAT family N-acetyltransferase, partial [Planctomycetota bacterium]